MMTNWLYRYLFLSIGILGYPVTSKFTLSLGASATGRSKLVMHDVLGHEVREIKLEGSNTVIDTEAMLPGMYLLSIVTENGKCIQRKIIKK